MVSGSVKNCEDGTGVIEVWETLAYEVVCVYVCVCACVCVCVSGEESSICILGFVLQVL